MGLRRRIERLRRRIGHLSYRWRLFIPLALMMWVVLGVFMAWSYKSQRDYRVGLMKDQLEMIDDAVLHAYEANDNLPHFVKFVGNFYEGTMFQEVFISVYDDNDMLIAHKGDVLPLDHENYDVAQEWDTGSPDSRSALVHGYDRSKLFFCTTNTSRDGNVTVITAMPFTHTIKNAVEGSSTVLVIFTLLMALATLVVFMSTRLLSRNILLLRDFALRAAAGKPIKSLDKLPHDELGEISREIFRIYDQRVQANKKSEREHRIALHAVEEKARVRKQLTNNINHELKTPIGVIRGYLETVLTNPDMDEATRNHFLNRTLQNVERLVQLMNDVSTMTRLEEGAENIPVSEVNMHDLLYAIENDVQASKIAGDMKFSYELPLDCNVQGNQNLLSGLIMNLIRNAAMHSHGTEITFSLVSESAKFFVFSFADNGSGVAPEHLPHLFERFYRVDTGRSRKVGGTGLGLPIVKNTITSLGGTISVHNRASGGLEFVFSLKKWE